MLKGLFIELLRLCGGARAGEVVIRYSTCDGSSTAGMEYLVSARFKGGVLLESIVELERELERELVREFENPNELKKDPSAKLLFLVRAEV